MTFPADGFPMDLFHNLFLHSGLRINGIKNQEGEEDKAQLGCNHDKAKKEKNVKRVMEFHVAR